MDHDSFLLALGRFVWEERERVWVGNQGRRARSLPLIADAQTHRVTQTNRAKVGAAIKKSGYSTCGT